MELACLATHHVISVSPGDSIDKAIGLVDEHDIHHLPVVERARLAGMTAGSDLVPILAPPG